MGRRYWFEDQDESDKFIAEWSLGEYARFKCEKCGCQRVCICPNGKHRCEKCYWCPENKRYISFDGPP